MKLDHVEELPHRQAALFARLALSAGEDVPIANLYTLATGGEADGVPAPLQQARLGSTITRLNRRLRQHRLAVKPGRIKRTYRLVEI